MKKIFVFFLLIGFCGSVNSYWLNYNTMELTPCNNEVEYQNTQGTPAYCEFAYTAPGNVDQYNVYRWISDGTDICPNGAAWDFQANSCPYDCSQDTGDVQGWLELPDYPPDGASCYTFDSKNCAIVPYEFFQSDSGTWWTSYVATGESCSPQGGEPSYNVDAPEPNDNTLVDTDDDGNPNNNDDDIDGDSIPNSTDTDADGDGIPNADDPTPWGYEENSFASTGENCAQIPSCKGDAIQCAQLMEIWRLRCKNTENDLNEEIADSYDDTLLSQSQDVDGLLDAYEANQIDALETEHAMTFDDTIFTQIEDIFTPGACSEFNLDFGEWGSFTMTCADSAPVRVIIGIVFAIMTVFACFNLLMRPVD